MSRKLTLWTMVQSQWLYMDRFGVNCNEKSDNSKELEYIKDLYCLTIYTLTH